MSIQPIEYLILALCIILIILRLGFQQRGFKSKKEEYLTTSIAGVGFIGIIVLLFYSQSLNNRSLKNNSIDTIGEVVGFNRKKSVTWKYESRKKDYQFIRNGEKFIGLQEGEKFIARYDSTNYRNAEIFFDSPVITDFQKDTISQYQFKHGQITDSQIYVTFTYNYNSTKYERQQLLPRNEQWEAIDSFIVILNKENPKVAYLKPK